LRQVQLRVDVVAAGGAGETGEDGRGLAASFVADETGVALLIDPRAPRQLQDLLLTQARRPVDESFTAPSGAALPVKPK